MSLDVLIRDGEGTKKTAGVTDNRALKVSVIDPVYTDISLEDALPSLLARKQFKDFLKNGSSKELNVNGSTTPVTFKQMSEEGKIKWLIGIRILLNGTYFEINTNDFRRFGTAAIAPGLTNGITLEVSQSGIVTDLFAEPVKYVGQFLDYADSFTNLVNSVSSQSDFLAFDFSFDAPIVLPAGTTDFIGLTVQDDLSSLDLFRAIVRGYQEIL